MLTGFQQKLVSPSLSYSTAFSALSKDSGICRAFRFHLFSLYDPLKRQNPLNNQFFLFVYKHSVRPSGRNWLVRLYLKFSANLYASHFSRSDSGLCIYDFSSNFSILNNSPWITVPIQSWRRWYFILYQFAAFAYYANNSFFSVTT